MRITKMERHPEGFLTARVTVDSITVPVHNRYGSWKIDQAAGRMREVLPRVAAALSAKRREFERHEQRELLTGPTS